MRSEKHTLSPRAVRAIVVAVAGLAVAGCNSSPSPQQQTGNRGLLSMRRAQPLPDHIGPFKLGIPAEEFEALKASTEQGQSSEATQAPLTASNFSNFTGEYQNGKLYKISYDINAKWEKEIVDETIRLYGEPSQRVKTSSKNIIMSFEHALIWKDSTHILIISFSEASPEWIAAYEQVAGRPLHMNPYVSYRGSLIDSALEAERQEQVRQAEEERKLKAKEEYEREKGEVMKKLY